MTYGATTCVVAVPLATYSALRRAGKAMAADEDGPQSAFCEDNITTEPSPPYPCPPGGLPGFAPPWRTSLYAPLPVEPRKSGTAYGTARSLPTCFGRGPRWAARRREGTAGARVHWWSGSSWPTLMGPGGAVKPWEWQVP